MGTKVIETQCPECKAKFETEFEFQEPVAVVKEPDEAKLAEAATQLRERDVEIARLGQEVAGLSEKAGFYDDLNRLLETEEGFVDFANHFGYGNLIYKAAAPVLAAKVEEIVKVAESTVFDEPPDIENWDYLSNLRCWIRKAAPKTVAGTT